MKFTYLFIAFFFIIVSVKAEDTLNTKNKVTLYVGIGYNFYINEMQLYKDGIRMSNYGATFRLMWEPKYRLSLGFETGLIRMYQWQNPILRQERISLYVIPLNSVFCMQLSKIWYVNLALGTSILLNQIATKNDVNTAIQFAIVNIYAETGLKLRLSKKFMIIPSLTYVFISKTEDRSLLLQTKIGYTF